MPAVAMVDCKAKGFCALDSNGESMDVAPKDGFKKGWVHFSPEESISLPLAKMAVLVLTGGIGPRGTAKPAGEGTGGTLPEKSTPQ